MRKKCKPASLSTYHRRLHKAFLAGKQTQRIGQASGMAAKPFGREENCTVFRHPCGWSKGASPMIFLRRTLVAPIYRPCASYQGLPW